MSDILQRYSVTLFWSPEDKGFVGQTREFGASVSALGKSPEAALTELATAVELTEESYQARGLELPNPAKFTGELRVRMPKSLHAKLFHEAEREGVSMNALLISKLAKAL